MTLYCAFAVHPIARDETNADATPGLELLDTYILVELEGEIVIDPPTDIVILEIFNPRLLAIPLYPFV